LRIFTVYNIKGGVGKTTTAVNLSFLASLEMKSVLLWDFDSQAAATFALRIQDKLPVGVKKVFKGRRGIDRFIKGTDFEGFDLMPADFSYRKLEYLLANHRKPVKLIKTLFNQISAAYDCLFIDCAPGLTAASMSLLQATDFVLVPTIPSPLAIRPLAQLCKFLESVKADPRVLPFFSMVDRRKNLHKYALMNPPTEPFRFLQSSIPYSSLVEQMGVVRAPLPDFAPASPASGAFALLWDEIRQKTGLANPA
jgi:cellulose biosynthesis protein BcsQ